MKKIVTLIAFFIFLSALGTTVMSSSDYDKYWPQWRGPFANGISSSKNAPIEWGEDKNVKWKTAIPGKGHSTPIIWGDILYLTTAIATDKDGGDTSGSQAMVHGTGGSGAAGHPGMQTKGKAKAKGQTRRRGGGMQMERTNKVHTFDVLAINRNSGKIVWQTTVAEETPREGTHQFGSWASNAAVTDGKHIYAHFGSRGIYCLDMQGKVKWGRDFGQMEKHMNFGEGSSPLLYKNKLFVIWDHKGDSFLFVLDKQSGKDIWKIERDEGTTWSTPFAVESNGKTQVVISGTKRIRSYDFDSGELIWECGGLTNNVIPMPLQANGIIYLMSGFRGTAMLAIDPARAKGDITDTDAVVWKYGKNTPYTPSAILVNNRITMLKSNNGIMACLDAKTGAEIYVNKRLEGIGNIFASLVYSAGNIYVTGEKGIFYVVKEGPDFEIVAKNELKDNFIASPVILDDAIYLRGYKNLYCIEK